MSEDRDILQARHAKMATVGKSNAKTFQWLGFDGVELPVVAVQHVAEGDE